MQTTAMNSNHALLSFEVENLSNAARKKDKNFHIKRKLILEERTEDSPVDEEALALALSLETPPLCSPSLSSQLTLVLNPLGLSSHPAMPRFDDDLSAETSTGSDITAQVSHEPSTLSTLSTLAGADVTVRSQTMIREDTAAGPA